MTAVADISQSGFDSLFGADRGARGNGFEDLTALWAELVDAFLAAPEAARASVSGGVTEPLGRARLAAKALADGGVPDARNQAERQVSNVAETLRVELDIAGACALYDAIDAAVFADRLSGEDREALTAKAAQVIGFDHPVIVAIRG